MVDMTSANRTAIESIDYDIERLTAASALVSEYILKTQRGDDCEQAIQLLGGEVAWFQHKRSEAQEYLMDSDRNVIPIYSDYGEVKPPFPKLGE